jgi:hypothetical protein
VPSVVINSQNINTFFVSVTWDLQNRRAIFNFSGSTYNGSGMSLVQGISTSLVDQEGVVLSVIDFTNPANYIVPSVTQTYIVDLSSLNYAFLFQAYSISAAIKDQNGTIYTIPVFYTTICQPTNFQESGYVPGMFQVRSDCINNVLTVKEFTILVYNNLQPQSTTVSGTLSYPTGTISPVTFTNTPFSNNVVYTGQYNVNNTTIATYALPNDIYVLVAYVTMQQFNITCSNQVSDLLCCISELYQTKVKNCDNAIGKRAAQQLEEIELPFFLGLGQEINGQDSEWAYSYIKRTLNCNCGPNALGQNQVTPINPAVSNVVLIGASGTSIPSPAVSGNTKTFTISSNVYQVVMGNPSDTSFSITTNTATAGTVKYVITFNYANLAAAVYTATAGSDTLISQLNSLISATANINLSNLNGSCIIDLSSNNFFLSYIVPSGAVAVTNAIIGTTTYAAPGGLIVSNVTGIETWLNGLGLGTFEVDYTAGINGSYINVLTNSNTNNPVSMTLTLSSGAVVVPFQSTNTSLIAFLQAFINYVCGMTALQVALGSNLTLCSFNYNGQVVNANLSGTTNTQNDFNNAAAQSICNLAARINTLTGLTCAQLQGIFSDYPNASFNNAADRYLSIVGGNCTTLSGQQQALAFIAAVNAYPNVKSQFCAISCTTPGTCGVISAVNSAATGQTTIGFYGVSWTAPPTANQQVTLQYRLTGTTVWTTVNSAISIFPNGNINGTSPVSITGLTAATTYDIGVTNNCGGTVFVVQTTTQSSTVLSGSYLLDNVIYNICGDSAVTLYYSTAFGPGTTMYLNEGLTSQVTGYTLIAPVTGGQIYSLNSSTGVVGTNTGSTCNSGTEGSYILGNTTSAACSGSYQTLYTNGVFASGGILYQDSALTTRVTGYQYVLSSSVLYNLNETTGVIGGVTGTNCPATLTITFDTSGGAPIAFIATLSTGLVSDININDATANGFSGSSCAGSPIANAVAAPFTIPPGATTNSASPASSSGTWGSVGSTSLSEVVVNGSTVSNGTEFTIGSYTVTVVIASCTA